MRFLRPALMIALVAFCFSGIAMADDIHVIFDPTTVPAIVAGFNEIQQTNTPYLVSWTSCNQAVVPTSMQGDNACLLFLNLTGAPITDLNVSFTVNQALASANQTLGCSTLDSFLSSNNCSSVSGTLTLGQVVTFDFFGGTPVPTSNPPSFSAFYIAENGITNLTDVPQITVTVPTPEPGSLGLMLAGLLAVGFALFFKKP
jgi:hypothetical protein